MLNSRLFLILIFLAPSFVSSKSSSANFFECSHIEKNETLIDSFTLKDVANNLGSLVEGRLFYKNSSGHCIPTNETYLISVMDGGYPKILSTFNGHTLKAKMVKLAREDFLFVFYFSGGNQYVLRPYKFFNGLLKEINTPVFVSNIRSIELIDDMILINNQVYSDDGEATIKSESYRYQNGHFVLIKL